jgi:hypothetical protein
MDLTLTLKILLPKGDVLEYTAKDMGHIKNEITLFKEKYETEKMTPVFEIKVNFPEEIKSKQIPKSEKTEIKSKRTHKCERCKEKVWNAWYNGHQYCNDCLKEVKKQDRLFVHKKKKEVVLPMEEDFDIGDEE